MSTRTLSSTSGIISSPYWPRDYPSLQDCYWKIEVGRKKSIKIAFMDFDLEYDFGCDDDKVKVKGERSYWWFLSFACSIGGFYHLHSLIGW